MKRWSILVLCVACGDNAPNEPVFEPNSGSRLALQLHRFIDGAQLPAAHEFYDKELHTRCSPREWVDGATRCVPVADDAVYTDAACTRAVGRAFTIEEPTYFIGYDERNGRSLPDRVLVAGEEIAPVALIYLRSEGACVGPFANGNGVPLFSTSGGITGDSIVEMREGEVGDGNIGLRLYETTDGLRAPFELHDRMRDAPCTAVVQEDGIACAPKSAPTANVYSDPVCSRPAILLAEFEPVPAIAAVLEAGGCPSYRWIGAEVPLPVYRREGDRCRVAPVNGRAFAAEAPLALPMLGRTVEATPARRLQRIILDDGELRFFDSKLFDTATQADCRRFPIGGVTRCIPAALAPTTTLFEAGCMFAVPVAEVPAHACEPAAFAVLNGETDIEFHAIGDPPRTPLYRPIDGQCTPYTGTPTTVVNALGPALAPELFMEAIYFGER